MSYEIVRGDLEPDMTLTATVDGVAESLAGATSYVLRWMKPDEVVSSVAMIAADSTALVVPDDVIESVDTALDTATLTAHGLLTEDGPFRLTTTGTLPGGLALATDYWTIKVDANKVKLALTQGGAAVDITDAGTGTHTLSDVATTVRADLTTGRLKRVWVAGDTDQAGTHFGQLVVTLANGEVQTFPGDGSYYIWFVYPQLGD